MSTLADLRNSLRAILSDNLAGSYLWTDAALTLHINEAIRGYSSAFPRESEISISTVAEQAKYDLPADCVRVVRVGLGGSDGALLQEGGDAFGEGYEVYGCELVLLPPPSESGQAIAVRYLAVHEYLVSDGDVSTVPAGDEGLLLDSAASRAIESLMTEEAKRQLLEARTGKAATAAIEFYDGRYREGVRNRQRWIRTRKLIAS